MTVLFKSDQLGAAGRRLGCTKTMYITALLGPDSIALWMLEQTRERHHCDTWLRHLSKSVIGWADSRLVDGIARVVSRGWYRAGGPRRRTGPRRGRGFQVTFEGVPVTPTGVAGAAQAPLIAPQLPRTRVHCLRCCAVGVWCSPVLTY